MLGDLKAIYDVVDQILEKRRVSQEQKTRDKVLVALFKLGNEGRQGVSAESLEKDGGFTKLQISQAIESAKNEDWIIDYSSHGGMAWGLNQYSTYYVKGLLENQGKVDI